MSCDDRPCLNRRAFLVTTGAAATALPVLGACLGASGETLSNDVDINLSDYPGLATLNHTVLVDVGLDGPLAVTQTATDQFVITGTICTHQGCQVQVGGPGLTCPCHGSQFSIDGEVLRGPAGSPLPIYDWELNGDVLTIKGMG